MATTQSAGAFERALQTEVAGLARQAEIDDWRVARRTYGTFLPNFAFIGGMGSGKTTAAQYLTGYGYERWSFANPVRETAGQLWPGGERDREKLIGVGMKMREIDPDVWANYLFRTWDERTILLARPAVIDDCRFPNEWRGLKERGFVIVRVEAPQDVRKDRLIASGKYQNDEQFDDPSEHGLDDFPADYTLQNTGDQAAFEQRLHDLLEGEAKRR